MLHSKLLSPSRACLRLRMPCLVVVYIASVAVAQEPGGRRLFPSAPFAPVGISAWPIRTLKPGTKVLVTAVGAPSTSFACTVLSIEDDRLECAGRDGAVFDRIAVATISLPAKRPTRVSSIMIASGAACVTLALIIATHRSDGGGDANAAFAETGMLAIAAGGVVRSVENFRAYKPRYQTPIYVAPPMIAVAPAM